MRSLDYVLQFYRSLYCIRKDSFNAHNLHKRIGYYNNKEDNIIFSSKLRAKVYLFLCLAISND